MKTLPDQPDWRVIWDFPIINTADIIFVLQYFGTAFEFQVCVDYF